MRAALVLALCVGVAGCGAGEGKDFLEALRDADYQSFQTAPGYDTRQPSSAPHGGNVEIFIDATVVAALGMDSLQAWPDGSLIVKDGYNNAGDHVLLAAMEKRGTDWFWAEYELPSERIIAAGFNEGICTGCHSSGDDFVRAFSFPSN